MKANPKQASTQSSMAPGKSMPMNTDLPDLSYLTPEERKIIEGVINRQKEEEQKDAELLKKFDPKSHSVGSCESAHQDATSHLGNVMSNFVSEAVSAVIGGSATPSRTAGILDAVCGVCNKTKFADALGHVCANCQKKTCTRCGYQMNTGINKVQWTCRNCANADAQLPASANYPVGQMHAENRQFDEASKGNQVGQISEERTNERRFQRPIIAREPRRLLPKLDDEVKVHMGQSRSPSVNRSLRRRTSLFDEEREHRSHQNHAYFNQRGSEVEETGQLRTGPLFNYNDSAISEHSGSSTFSNYKAGAGNQRRLLKTVSSDIQFNRGDHARSQNFRPHLRDGYSGVQQSPSSLSVEVPRRNQPEMFDSASYRSDLGYSPYAQNMQASKYVSFSSSEEERARFPYDSSQYINVSDRTRETFPHDHHTYQHNPGLLNYEEVQPDRTQRLGYGNVDEVYDNNEFDYQPGTPRLAVLPKMMISPIRTGNNERVQWSQSRDGQYLIGRMTLSKSTEHYRGDGGTMFGFKLIGGRRTQAGHYGAFITRVKRNSHAHLVGRLRPGDEVLQLNGQDLRGLTADEVAEIISTCRLSNQIDIIVQRPIEEPSEMLEDEELLSSRFPSMHHSHSRNALSRKPTIQLELYFDQRRETLTVHVIGASDLSGLMFESPTCSAPCNSYCRVRLIHGNDEFQYSTLIAESNNPKWDQMFEFFGYNEHSIAQEELEVTVWNFQSNTNKQHFVGEVVIDLGMADLNGTPYWYPLQMGSVQDVHAEAATPIIENDPIYECGYNEGSLRAFRSDSLQAGHYHEDFSPLIHSANEYEDSKNLRRRHSGKLKRGNRSAHHPSAHDDILAHSDASEFSDMSEFSRISLATTQSEALKSPRLATTKRTSYSRLTPPPVLIKQADGKQTYRHRDPHFSLVDQDPRTVKSNVISSRSESPHTEKQMIGKESSSSECASGMAAQFTNSNNLLRHDQQASSGKSHKLSQPGLQKPRTGIGHKFSTVLGRSSKSSSTSNLEKKSRTRFQRCEEVLPFGSSDQSFDATGDSTGPDSSTHFHCRGELHHQLSVSTGKTNNLSEVDRGSSPALLRNESHVGEFVEGLGPGQLVGRQVLGMPCLGEIQLSFFDRKGHLEIEVIRARGLQHKNATKPIPAPYVKLHLLEGKMSVEKLRTTTQPRRTLDPLYQQQLTFSMPYHGKVVQVSVWGEYGRMDKKVFLGMCEIVLDDLDLTSVVFGWYKLFGMIAASAPHHQSQRHQHHSLRHKSALSTASEGTSQTGLKDVQSSATDKVRGWKKNATTVNLAKRISLGSDKTGQKTSVGSRSAHSKKSAVR